MRLAGTCTVFPSAQRERQDLASRPPLHHTEKASINYRSPVVTHGRQVKYRGIKAAGDDEMINILIFLTT